VGLGDPHGDRQGALGALRAVEQNQNPLKHDRALLSFHELVQAQSCRRIRLDGWGMRKRKRPEAAGVVRHSRGGRRRDGMWVYLVA
jgi:hypothetical protein